MEVVPAKVWQSHLLCCLADTSLWVRVFCLRKGGRRSYGAGAEFVPAGVDQAAKALAVIQLTGCKAVTSAWIYVRR